ncbi:hypothetical protein FLL95_01100, partial [Vibrio cholerae]
MDNVKKDVSGICSIEPASPSISNFFHITSVFEQVLNARLRGWQRITTKLNHNNRNPRGSLGLET